MKQTYIKDFRFGAQLTNEQFAVKNIRQGKTQAGKAYFDVTLSDRSGEVDGKIWEMNISNCAEVQIGDIVELSGKVEEFRDKQQLNITFMQKASQFEIGDFLPKSAKDQEALWKTVQSNIKKIKSKHIQKLIDCFFLDKEFVAEFKFAPGAERIHHAYIGGLLEHTAEMLDLANSLTDNYPDLDKDLLLCGVLLHDCGKMQELKVDHTIYRTVEGALVGHISLGAFMVEKAISAIKDFPAETRVKIINMILGHHEKLEFGSPMKPMTREAFALAHIDNLSAKVNTADKTVKDAENSEQEFSEKNFALDTKLYLG